MLDELKSVGLTEGEAKAYLALLELGSSTIGPIAKKSNISYSKIYEVLQRLLEKGLISFIVKEKTKHFQAVEPQRLHNFLEKQEEEIEKNKEKLKKVIPRLETLEKAHKHEEAQIFIGVKGLRTAYERLFGNAKKNEPSLFFYVYDEEYTEAVNNFYTHISSFFKEKGIKFYGIISGNKKRLKMQKLPPFNIKMRFVPFPLPGTIDIFQDKILHIAWRTKPLGILIQSVEIAENMRSYFDRVWKSAKRL